MRQRVALAKGLALNAGFGISNVGLDVVLREHYSYDIVDWNSPHWEQPTDEHVEMGATVQYAARYSPMLFGTCPPARTLSPTPR